MLSLLPCKVPSTELPATTEEESSRGGSSQGHTGGPLTDFFLPVVLTGVQGCVFEATGTLILVGSVTPRQGDQPKYWLVTSPETGGHHPKNWKAAGIFLTWAVTRLEVVAGSTLASILVRRWLLFSTAWFACTSLSRRASSPLVSFLRVLAASPATLDLVNVAPRWFCPCLWAYFLGMSP